MISQQLDLIGFHVDVAENGEAAFEAFMSGRYALVLTDLNMPKMNGYELADAIRRYERRTGRQRTPVIALSANVMRGEPEKTRAAGMDDFMAKPTTMPFMASKLKQWLSHVEWETDDAARRRGRQRCRQRRGRRSMPPRSSCSPAGTTATADAVLADFLATTRDDVRSLHEAIGSRGVGGHPPARPPHQGRRAHGRRRSAVAHRAAAGVGGGRQRPYRLERDRRARRPARGRAGELRVSGMHAAKVAAIQDRVQALSQAGGPVHIEKGGVHHFVPLAGDRRFGGRAVDVSALNEVLEIDADGRTCTAEPGATFAEVVRATLAQGLLPKVVPELEGITLGGAVAGCSVESMSYKFGGFHDTCREYEIVTGAGERRVLTPADEHFHMLHGSYGTLAILTRIRFELIEAAPFVEVTYKRHRDFAAFADDMHACCSDESVDFVDGIIHAPDELVLCVGRFVAAAGTPGPSSYRGTRVYYRSTRELPRDVLSTFDYCFRYETDCHWLSRTVPPLEWPLVRRLAGRWFLGSANLIRWSKRTEKLFGLVKKRPDVVVDVFIPGSRFADFWDWYARDFRFWPLWIVPYRIEQPYPWIAADHAAAMTDRLMIDCAVYGKRNNDRDVDWSQAIEEKTYELGGIKTLISRNHHTRERFWQIYHRDRWEAAKRELDPPGLFRDLYDKFHAGG